MKKLHTYLALFLLVFLACIPPIDFFISLPPMDLWFVIILLAGFFGIYTLFLKINWIIKVVAISSFILCFLCPSPLLAFTSYVPFILGCYFYINCTKIEDWGIIFRALQTLLFLNVLLVIMQLTGHDALLNFGLYKAITGYGIIGQHMQMGSFSVVLAAVLLPMSIANLIFPLSIAFFCHSAWTLFCAGVGVFFILGQRYKTVARVFAVLCVGFFIVFSLKEEKFVSNGALAENGRTIVWIKSIDCALQRPWTGWGMGTYKILFPSLGKTLNPTIPYKSAHNWVVQMLFEMGIPFTLFIVGALGCLLWRLYEGRHMICFAALSMILCDGLVHFPDRMLQTVGLIILFLAYCEVKLRV